MTENSTTKTDFSEFKDWYNKELKYMEFYYPSPMITPATTMSVIEYGAWKAWQAARRSKT